MGFVERELDRINRALINQDKGPVYDRLYSAQTALAWCLEPTGIMSPFDLIMGKRAGKEEDLIDCSIGLHPLGS